MVEASNYDEAVRVLIEAEHNPAGERLLHLAHVRATLAVAEELRSLRAAVALLSEALSPGDKPASL